MTAFFHSQTPKKDKSEEVWEYPSSYPCLQRQCLIYRMPTAHTPPQLVSLRIHTRRAWHFLQIAIWPFIYRILVLLLRMTTAHQEIWGGGEGWQGTTTQYTHPPPCAKRKGDACAKLFSKIMLENWAVTWKDNFRWIDSYAAHVLNLYANKQYSTALLFIPSDCGRMGVGSFALPKCQPLAKRYIWLLVSAADVKWASFPFSDLLKDNKNSSREGNNRGQQK